MLAWIKTERNSYENSLKYYRDMKNVIDTAKGEGWEEGRAEGRAEGHAEGRAEGRAEGEAKALIKILEKRFDTVPESFRKVILSGTADQLEEWIEAALDAPSVEAVFDGE